MYKLDLTAIKTSSITKTWSDEIEEALDWLEKYCPLVTSSVEMYMPHILKDIKLEKRSDGYFDIDEDWLHKIVGTINSDLLYLHLSDNEWDGLGIKPTLRGQSQPVDGQGVLYGRWHEKMASPYKKYYKDTPFADLSEQAQGIIHEFSHVCARLSNLDSRLPHLFFYGKRNIADPDSHSYRWKLPPRPDLFFKLVKWELFLKPYKPEMTPKEFILKAREAAEIAAKKVPFSVPVAVAQAALESDYGKSPLTAYNNLKGIKAGSSWSGQTVEFPTSEFIGGRWVRTIAKWRVYDSWVDSFVDYGEMIHRLPWYQDAEDNINDPAEFLKGLVTGNYVDGVYYPQKYATDPKYIEKVWAIVEQYNLSPKPTFVEWLTPFLPVLVSRKLPQDLFIQVILLLKKIYDRNYNA